MILVWLNMGRSSMTGQLLVRPGGGEQLGRVLRPQVPGRGRAGSVGRNLQDWIRSMKGSP